MVDGDDQKMIKCSTWNRRKRKTKPYGDRGKGIGYGFGFGNQGTIESVITFRIDSRTIKRRNLWLSGYRVPLDDMILAYAFRNLVC